MECKYYFDLIFLKLIFFYTVNQRLDFFYDNELNSYMHPAIRTWLYNAVECLKTLLLHLLNKKIKKSVSVLEVSYLIFILLLVPLCVWFFCVIGDCAKFGQIGRAHMKLK